MPLSPFEIAFLVLALVLVAAVLFAVVRVTRLGAAQAEALANFERALEGKHIAMLRDLNAGLTALGDRLTDGGAERSEQLRATVDQQLRQTRDALVALQISTNQELAANRETLSAGVAESRQSVLAQLGEHREAALAQINALREGLLAQLAELRESLSAGVAESRQSVTTHLGEHREATLGQLNALREGLLAQLGEMRESLAAGLADSRQSVTTHLGEHREVTVAQLNTVREMLLAQLAEHREAVLARLGEMRSEMLEKSLAALAEQGRVQNETVRESVRALALQLSGTVETLTRTTDARLEQIQGRVNERLEEGFKKTNETFTSVMTRLATIDEAQRKIDGLTTNVVSLQELLGDKRSRGAFGEVQLENLVRNILPPTAYAFQHTLTNHHRADCVLLLPEPTGKVAVDSKFPLENYHRMFDPGLGETERREAQRQFRADVKKHVDDIATRYIIEGETSDGAVMFIPAEAVFAEIHAYHAEVVDHAMQRRVWIVSPTTMMAVLNTARAVMKDVETRRQVHVIKDELGKLGKDFGRFEQRMKKLADHIRQAHDDAQDVQISSGKIVKRFHQIERVELEAPGDVARLEQVLAAPDDADEPDAAAPSA